MAANPPTLDVGVRALNPLETTAQALHSYLSELEKGTPATMRIFDLRTPEEFEERHIPTSVSMSFNADMALAPLAAELHELVLSNGTSGTDTSAPRDRPLFLFVSRQSPDIDDLVSRDLIREYEKAYGHSPPSHAVAVLVGGTMGYMDEYPDTM